MFARVATFEGVDVDALAPVLAWYEQHGRELNAQMAGYRGSLSLLDRAARRGVDIHFYDSDAHAKHADDSMDQGPPPEMPPELAEIMMRAERSSRAVLEVFAADGLLACSRSFALARDRLTPWRVRSLTSPSHSATRR